VLASSGSIAGSLLVWARSDSRSGWGMVGG
jgi:hypothetical protein